MSGCVGDESSAHTNCSLFSFLSCVSLSILLCVSLSFPLLGSCRSQAVCSLNRLDLSTDSGAASVFNSAHASPFTLVCGFMGFGDFHTGTLPVATCTAYLWAALMPLKFLISNNFFFISYSPLALSADVAFNHEFRDNRGSCSTTNPLHNIALIHQGELNNA